MRHPVGSPAIVAILASATLAERAAGDEVVFLNALSNAPLEFEHRPDQAITPQVESFWATGVNPYFGDAEAAAAGKVDYDRLCASCHLKDGTGRIGPNLTDDEWKYPRTGTEVGRFEIIYGGGAGSMQPFGRRIDQDAILKVMAYVDTLAAE